MKKIKIKKDDEFMYYPTLDDEKFYENIYVKKEFYKNRIPKETKDITELCNPREFTLAPQQNFLKNYISIETPYNGVLVFWLTGSGKSCAAISIAEQFKEHLRKYNKKVLIILKKSIQKGFLKQIYDLKKEGEKTKKDDVVQCTGDTYSLSEEDKTLTLDQKKRKIKSNIKQNYQFVGYEQFANEVKRKTNWDGEIKELTPEIIKKIEREYSNRIIIIDEVHHINVKKTADVNIKKVPPILETIVRYSKNVRLILMSATPMYDKPEEIIYLLNLLLLNDKREPIKITDVFDTSGMITVKGEKKLSEISKGYVSYVRGQNPITFPIRLYAPGSVVPKIKYDIRGNILEKDAEIRYLKLILCDMSDYQYKWYTILMRGTQNFEELNLNNVNNEEENEKKDIGLKNLIYASNIVYPTKQGKAVYAKYGITTSDDGNGALYKETLIINKRKRVIYKYQSHVIFDKGTKNEEPFLSKKYLQKYSDKFYTTLNNVIKAKGIVFVYSRYLPAGVIPFALSLEQNGIQRYEVDGDKQLLDYKSNSKGGGGKTNPICYLCGKFASDPIHKPTNPNYHKWYAAKYILLTGDKNLTKVDISKAMDIVNNNDNEYGQHVKIILGNEAVSEGIDFHRIRQVHILEPWYNISSLEQIIGRAIRHCSHKTLPEVQRNVEIFLYASVAPKNATIREKETETIDEYNYRLSEVKDIKIKSAERILKESAVDCLLNKSGNIYINDKEINIETSSGKKVKYKISDKPYSRICDYRGDCNYKCNWEPVKDKVIKVNEDTYNLIFAKTDIDLAKKYIKMMYRKNIIYDLDLIVKNVKNKIPGIENKFIYKALDNIVKNKDEIVYDKFNREGYLIYRGKYYIFQPKELTYESIPLYYRGVPLTSKSKSLPLLNYTIDIGEENTDDDKDIISIIERKISEYGKILEDTIKINNISIDDSFESILGMVLDRLSETDIISLLKRLIIKHNKNQLDDKIEKKIIEYYIDNLFLDSMVTNKKKKLSGEILGFRYHNKYYCLKNNVWSICSDDIRKKIELLDKVSVKKDKKEGLLLGLITYNKRGDVVFQIVDTKKYREAITLQQKKSQRSTITGRVCDTYKLVNLNNIQEDLRMKRSKKGVEKKEKLCVEIEFFFRYKNNIDSTRKWIRNNVKMFV